MPLRTVPRRITAAELRAQEHEQGVAQHGAFRDRLQAHVDSRYVEIVRYARAIVGSVEDAEDCVSDAILAALKYERTYKPRYPLPVWFRAILRHCCRRCVQRRVRGAEMVSSLVVTEDPPAGALALGGPDVWAALDRLPDVERVLLIRRYVDGVPAADIARRQGCRPDAVRQRLATARRMLRQELAQDRG